MFFRANFSRRIRIFNQKTRISPRWWDIWSERYNPHWAIWPKMCRIIYCPRIAQAPAARIVFFCRRLKFSAFVLFWNQKQKNQNKTKRKRKKKSSRSETRTHNLPVNSRARYRLRHPGKDGVNIKTIHRQVREQQARVKRSGLGKSQDKNQILHRTWSDRKWVNQPDLEDRTQEKLSWGPQLTPISVEKTQTSSSRVTEQNMTRQCVRVVKEVDSKSTGLCPREFKSRRCRFFCLFCFDLTSIRGLRLNERLCSGPC